MALGFPGRHAIGTFDQFKLKVALTRAVMEYATGLFDHLGADTVATEYQNPQAHSASTGSSR